MCFRCSGFFLGHCSMVLHFIISGGCIRCTRRQCTAAQGRVEAPRHGATAVALAEQVPSTSLSHTPTVAVNCTRLPKPLRGDMLTRPSNGSATPKATPQCTRSKAALFHEYMSHKVAKLRHHLEHTLRTPHISIPHPSRC